ncbi:toprim domain-containing protein (plasmid) [Novosphingobium resinovorum]|uniref:toprim domain-containing protein n=1 Tax=Novosphingobium TaxID=165696 RepID=UPI0025A25B0A|nr:MULTISPECIES: toprim domain-containing protein [Novosphingobium]WJM30122.1 toprim domain-containing protein [Novosphingobium resinovorum]
MFKPAVLVAVREGQRLVALQRIFLDPETARYTGKATIGSLGMCAWRGGGIGPTIGLAEGFETARAWSLLHKLPCWATLGSRRFGLATIPDSVTELILAGDCDIAGRRAVNRASHRYASDNRVIRVDFPKGYKDWAQALEALETQKRDTMGAGRCQR